MTYKQKRLIVRRTRLVGPDFGGSNLKVLLTRSRQCTFCPTNCEWTFALSSLGVTA